MRKTLSLALLALAATMPATAPAQTLQDLLQRLQRPAAGARPRAEPRPASPAPGTAPLAAPQSEPSRTQQENFQPGRYDGPARWGFDAAFANKIARLGVFITGDEKDQRIGGDPMPSLGLYTLNLQRTSTITFRDVMAKQAVPGSMLDCEYRRTQPTATEAARPEFRPEYIKIFFWHAGKRQALSAQMLKPYQSRSDQIADVELDTCPPDFASALSAAYGSSAWQAPTQLALKARDDEVRENIDTGIWYETDYSGWAKQPKALPAAEDRALAQAIDKTLRELEAKGSGLTSRIYYTAVNKQLDPALARLAASGVAQARAIPKGAGGVKAFETWDNGVGVTVVSLVMRMHRWGQPSNLAIGVLGTYMGLYGEQFADKGALDSRYYAQMMASIEKYKAQEADRSVAAPTFDSQRSAGVWVMRPRQSALYRMVSAGVRVVAAYSAARAEIENYLNTLEREIPRAREAFWQCYERRCADGGRLYLEFSSLLSEFDRFLIMRTAWEGAVARTYGDARHGATFLKLMGMDRDVNTNLAGACDSAYSRFLGQFVTWMSLDAADMRRRMDAALGGDDYLQLQQCRDQMEFILRPRAQKSSLL